MGSKFSNNSVLSFGTDQTAIHGLKSTKSFTRLLKPKITEYEKTPTSRSCRNSPKPVSTHSSRGVEQLYFLARRDPTVRKPRNLERSWSFSLYNLKSPFTARPAPKSEKMSLFIFILFLFCPSLATCQPLIG